MSLDKDNVTTEKNESVVSSVQGFFKEVNAEFHRITWPKGKELTESTGVVLTFIVILAATVFVFDTLIQWLLGIILK